MIIDLRTARIGAVLIALLASPATGQAPQARPDTLTHDEIKRIVRHLDDLYRSTSSYSVVEMQIVTPNWSRTLTMDAWTHGLDRMFIRITGPKKEEGVATLRIGSEMWNYLPRTDKIIKVPPSMMMSSWMGSDFTNDDLVKEFTLIDDYTFSEDADSSDASVVRIRCVPKPGTPIVWGSVVIAVRRTGDIPVWERYYDEHGRLMRVLTYGDVREFGGRRLPSTLTMAPENKEGHRTVIRYLQLEFDAGVKDEVFSLRNLRSGR
jgi:outer membrane lipoprotein-sorting protein